MSFKSYLRVEKRVGQMAVKRAGYWVGQMVAKRVAQLAVNWVQ